MTFIYGVAVILLIIIALGFRVIKQQTVAVVETFGQYTKMLEPGLSYIFFPFQTIAHTVNLRIIELKSHVSIKTNDNTFVGMPVSIMISVIPDKANTSVYMLSYPEAQIQSWVLNTIRAITSNMSLQDLFNDRSHIISNVESELSGKLYDYGYQLNGVLIDEPKLPDEMQRSFNAVVSAKREKEAAVDQGEAARIIMVAQAQAESEAQVKRAEGLSKSRMVLAEGLKDSLNMLEGDLTASEAMAILLTTAKIDAMREIGKHGNLIITDMHNNSLSTTDTALLTSMVDGHKSIATQA